MPLIVRSATLNQGEVITVPSDRLWQIQSGGGLEHWKILLPAGGVSPLVDGYYVPGDSEIYADKSDAVSINLVYIELKEEETESMPVEITRYEKALPLDLIPSITYSTELGGIRFSLASLRLGSEYIYLSNMPDENATPDIVSIKWTPEGGFVDYPFPGFTDLSTYDPITGVSSYTVTSDLILPSEAKDAIPEVIFKGNSARPVSNPIMGGVAPYQATVAVDITNVVIPELVPDVPNMLSFTASSDSGVSSVRTSQHQNGVTGTINIDGSYSRSLNVEASIYPTRDFTAGWLDGSRYNTAVSRSSSLIFRVYPTATDNYSDVRYNLAPTDFTVSTNIVNIEVPIRETPDVEPEAVSFSIPYTTGTSPVLGYVDYTGLSKFTVTQVLNADSWDFTVRTNVPTGSYDFREYRGGAGTVYLYDDTYITPIYLTIDTI